MPQEPLVALGAEFRRFRDQYSGTPHAMRNYAAVIGGALLLLAFPLVTRSLMLYILVSRDPTILEAELTANEALTALQNDNKAPNAVDSSRIVETQQRLWNRLIVLLGQLERKIPQPDWIGDSMKYLGLLSALLAMVGGLSTTILAWKTERRATAEFMVKMEDRLAELEKRSSKIVTPPITN